jgi:hypothetical protein
VVVPATLLVAAAIDCVVFVGLLQKMFLKED